MLTKKQSLRREELRTQFFHHQNEASKYHRQIDLIDKKAKDKELKSILGKCFLQRSDMDTTRGNSGYVRVESFRADYTPVGTQINIYGKGKTAIMTIELNHGLFDSWIKNGHQISHAKFNKLLKQAISMIKLKK